MSLTKDVAALIEEIGAGTADDLMPYFESHTRAQVRGALKAARAAGLIDSERPQRMANRPHRASGRPRGSAPTTYRQIKAAPRPRVSSVWELGAMHT